ncbi:MAG: hypothetical protein Q7U68_04185, partial [Candidatus Roizmanbacteria bacterium]|nr:hypothetical protein [Candidatus Roizmanbacteria bacterium]
MGYHKKFSIFNFQFSNGRNVFLLIFIIALFLYFLIKSITGSVFLKGRDKINVVFYGKNTRFYSLDRK